MTGRPKLMLRLQSDSPAARTIIMKDRGAYIVRIDPPQPNFERPETFATHKAARGFAGGIRLTLRIPNDDQTGEGVDG